MAIPTHPTNFFDRPFAADGDKEIIPVSGSTTRATLSSGFPMATQLPKRDGGVAPNRLDFNGLGNMLSAFIMWFQSGGIIQYQDSKVNYVPNSIVTHENGLWFCVKENGPESANGVVAPGTDTEYWVDLLTAIADRSGGGGGGGLFPVGGVLGFPATTAPAGFLALDGSSFSATTYPKLYAVLGTTVLPDYRGCFIRGYDTRNDVDPDGASRLIGSFQVDAGRNAIGSFAGGNSSYSTGVFSIVSALGRASGNNTVYAFDMDLSRAWGADHVAAEFRPVNRTLLWCIKHD